ncbi:tetrapyrrole biosynthesis, uroporphyrinogen III synthase [Mycena belliarum]|uniref:Tetrapyrrole biosynthesis, uroporphyrinogen III synthase n=1 Tax=Mycena belliarum TaxID=1033014 RepID=A0AAD6UIL1_9AGAR|nr:tetrapyrrole biosynthesis, uroporphyrinogen III synthase [Mycena belliae]
MANVLLLREPSKSPTSPDRYESTLTASGYKPLSVPVLETIFTNVASLTDIVRNDMLHGAVVITSGRACEAWGNVVEALESGQVSRQESKWASTPFYVVGKSTASALNLIRSAHPRSPFVPMDIRGESSGTSEQLAKFILEDLDSSPPSRQIPFLYLTGDKNRDTLPDILRAGNVDLIPLQVYQTQGSSSMSQDLKLALDWSSPGDNSSNWWIVFFAPSAAELAIPLLRQYFDLPPDPTSSARLSARIASIGPTTSAFLRDELSLRVDAAALKPSPDELLKAIVSYDEFHDH